MKSQPHLNNTGREGVCGPWGGNTDFTGSVAQGLNDDKRELKQITGCLENVH